MKHRACKEVGFEGKDPPGHFVVQDVAVGVDGTAACEKTRVPACVQDEEDGKEHPRGGDRAPCIAQVPKVKCHHTTNTPQRCVHAIHPHIEKKGGVLGGGSVEKGQRFVKL